MSDGSLIERRGARNIEIEVVQAQQEQEKLKNRERSSRCFPVYSGAYRATPEEWADFDMRASDLFDAAKRSTFV
jgi:hypothetical protein